MSAEFNLQRFVAAQEGEYENAFQEMKNGRKRTHWMWYIFPQIEGLGRSGMAQRYAIKNMAEAAAYLAHPILGNRLIEISQTLLGLPGSNATAIMGSPDDRKLHSSMTLFSLVPGSPPVFNKVLSKYFGGKADQGTLRFINP